MSVHGFSLIEVLMVVFVMGIVVVVGSQLFFSVLKGASKTELVKQVKQNGDYALGVMERQIRSAKSIKECTPTSLRIVNQDDNETVFTCLLQDDVNKIASNSSTLTGNSVTLGSGACPGSLLFDCNGATLTPPKVTVTFSLYQKGSSTRPEEQAQLFFQQTISLRTY
ncbi:MAG: prepilin-type N-terminal cleavage/methylation domain-containing protein [bacterium]|nr:prepilin-type N-terminal cleavage/methylation domain-containing protein [bacterium]